MITPRSPRRRQPTRTPQPRRPGAGTARTFEAPDYTRDYAYVRQDLLLILLIGGLLFAGLVAASFFL